MQTPTVRIYLTGIIWIEGPKRSINERQFPGRQGRLAFAMLVSERQRALTRDEIANEIWPDTLPPASEQALSALMSKLRSLLKAAGLPDKTLTSAFGCYQIQLPEPAWVDAEVGRRALESAEVALAQEDYVTAAGWSEAAYHIYRRPLLQGESGPWASRKQDEHRDLYVRALTALARVWLWNGDTDRAARDAREAISLDPFRETSYQVLMHALDQGGNRAEALREYERFRRFLEEELGVSPAPETEAIYLEILKR